MIVHLPRRTDTVQVPKLAALEGPPFCAEGTQLRKKVQMRKPEEFEFMSPHSSVYLRDVLLDIIYWGIPKNAEK